MIDWDRVDSLRGEIGDDAFADVVVLFLKECDETMEGIVKQGQAGPEMRHFLKGAALNLGFAALAKLCDDPVEGADPARLQAVYAETRSAFVAAVGIGGL